MEKKTSKNILLIIMGMLVLAELIAAVLTINRQNIIRTLCKIISSTFIALYGLWLYKKPHGNILKCAMLLLAISEIITAAQCMRVGLINFYLNLFWIFVAITVVYIAGRLDRVEQNKYLLVFAVIVQLIVVIVSIASEAGSRTPLRLFTWFSGAISIITLMIAYFARYKEHKEAGIEDAPRK